MANLRTQLFDKRKFAVVSSHNEKVLEICDLTQERVRGSFLSFEACCESYFGLTPMVAQSMINYN